MDEDQIVEAIQSAISRFVEGSSSGASGVCWRIHNSLDNNREVAWFRHREERDLHLRWKNAYAAWDVAKTELAKAVHEPLRALEAAAQIADQETITAPNAPGWHAIRVVLRRVAELRAVIT